MFETNSTLSRVIQDYYRCPEASLGFALNGKLSDDEGYFHFGEDVVCYGRSASGVRQARVETDLYDALRDTATVHEQVNLPFDPSEVIENLRRERYAHNERFWDGPESPLKKLYYLLRPMLSLRARRRIQRFHARDWKKRSFPHWPVDTTVEDLCEKLLLLSMEAKGLDRIPFVWFWPNGARGCVLMTHDVETAAGRDFCDELMDLDDAYGIKACFNVVPEGRYALPKSLLGRMRGRGFDFGIQDLNHDGRLFDNREQFLHRAAIINRYAAEYSSTGFRAAVLYRRPEWFDCLNFSFDMSIPNVAHFDPQRGGCCTVMPYFIGNMLELPVTTVQDYTLMHLLNERSIDLWKAQMEMILGKSGLASFIVHPDYVMEPETQALYRNLLEHLRSVREQGQTWFALPADIDSWWRTRNQMSVEKTGNSWQVVGEGSERAVLAYAVRCGSRLIYEVPAADEGLLSANTTVLANRAHC